MFCFLAQGGGILHFLPGVLVFKGCLMHYHRAKFLLVRRLACPRAIIHSGTLGLKPYMRWHWAVPYLEPESSSEFTLTAWIKSLWHHFPALALSQGPLSTYRQDSQDARSYLLLSTYPRHALCSSLESAEYLLMLISLLQMHSIITLLISSQITDCRA